MIEVIAHTGQTLVDIALQEYGCFEGVFTLAEDNGIDPTHAVAAGEVLQVRDVVPKITDDNQAVAKYYKENNIKVNSGFGIAEPTGEPPVETEFYDSDFYDTDNYA